MMMRIGMVWGQFELIISYESVIDQPIFLHDEFDALN